MKHNIVVSIHIPKTGGVTFKNILSSVYGDSFLWFTETNSPRHSFERLRGYDLSKVKCIHGHMGYGMHKYLATLNIDCTYILFTRNIEDRLLSYYNYIMTGAVKAHYKWEDRFGWKDNITFYDWLYSLKMADQDNSLVRFLSGCESLNTDPFKYRMCKTDCDIALENLSTISFVGSVDRFDTDINRLASHLGWGKIPQYGRDNSNPNHRYRRDLSSIERALIWDTQKFDIVVKDKIEQMRMHNENETRRIYKSTEGIL